MSGSFIQQSPEHAQSGWAHMFLSWSCHLYKQNKNTTYKQHIMSASVWCKYTTIYMQASFYTEQRVCKRHSGNDLIYTRNSCGRGFASSTIKLQWVRSSRQHTTYKSSAPEQARSLTWLCCCCCWSLSWRIAWASPPVELLVPACDLSVETVRTTSNTAEEETPANPVRSLKRPRLARTHMGSTDEADILDCSTSCRRACVTWVKRTKAPDWLRLIWVTAIRCIQSSDRSRGAERGGS